MFRVGQHYIKKHLEPKKHNKSEFQALYSLWQVVQNFQFAKAQEKTHKKSNFKHFAWSVPDLGNKILARTKLRLT